MTKDLDWQNGLKEAFQRNALTGLFIDLQRDFLDNFTHAAFQNSAKVAGNLSARNIPNIWAIWPTEHIPYGPYSYLSLNSILPNAITIATPAHDDLVFCKYARNLLTNPEAKAHIKTLAAPPVIIAGGVYASRCFSSTINGLIDMIDCDIIVPFDATDMQSVEDVQKLFHNGKTDHMLKPKGRIHPTSTAEVLDVIHSL
ncbi:MAG: hypothetical protein ACK4VI_07755 [Alphaproteobacteria bacterium]